MSCSRVRFVSRVALFAALISFARGASADDLRGRLIDKVACEADAAQTYALYLPSNYVREKRWPAIFCFDAAARGRMPVERLQAAAEKYGYIVAGSLTSRNGPWAANAAAAQAMMRDVSVHLSIDPARVYTAGVSGGARVASGIALSGSAKGVIACAAGFPQPVEIPTRLPFVFFGTAGTEDFNYQEMRRLDGELERRKATYRIVVFAGEHQWAPAEIMTEAVEWFELQAMRSGVRPKDPAFIEAEQRKRQAALPVTPVEARWRALKSFVADFDGLAETAALRQEAKALGESRALKDALKAERALQDREETLIGQLGDAVEDGLARKRTLVAEIRRAMEAPENSVDRQAARRAAASYQMMARETARAMFEDNRYDDAAGFLELAALLNPKRASNWYELARARGFVGDQRQAIEALSAAVDAGYTDAAKTEADEAFKKFRSKPAFAAVVSRMRTAPSDDLVKLPTVRVSALLAAVELRLFYLPNAGGEVSALSFLRVETVRANSVAARAGIVEGMEVVAIQGKRVRGLTEPELNEVMALPVTDELVVRIRDAGKDERDVRIAVRKNSIPSGSAAGAIK